MHYLDALNHAHCRDDMIRFPSLGGALQLAQPDWGPLASHLVANYQVAQSHGGLITQ